MKELPYTPDPKKLKIKYVDSINYWMTLARQNAELYSLDKNVQTGAVIAVANRSVWHSKSSVAGVNGSWFHKIFGCPRKLFKCETGKGYWMCPGCSPRNHAEQKAIRNAKIAEIGTKNAELYLWGHWWCCKSCCDAMIKAGIRTVYLSEERI